MKSKSYDNLQKALGGFVRFIFRVHAHTPENEPAENEGQYIIVSNHISNVDPIILCSVLKKQQPHYMAKKELFKVPVLKGIIKAMGAFPVNRGGVDVSAIKHSIKLLEEGKCIGIFPQGHRYKGVDPKETDVKTGAAMLACKTQTQILPCFLKTKKRKLAFLSRVDVIIGKPISFEELSFDPEGKGEYARVSKLIFDRVCELEETDTKKKKGK